MIETEGVVFHPQPIPRFYKERHVGFAGYFTLGPDRKVEGI